jgi:FAD/FMN-containing dehydrogenase
MTHDWTDQYCAWGRTIKARHLVEHPHTVKAAREAISARNDLTVLGYGCGRSYGDVLLNPNGNLIDCRGLDRFESFDRTSGVLVAESGVRLADILAIIAKPEPSGGGWLPPVTPGTRFVTIGGAIANDVHGKNHHTVGTFGRHVLWLDLARSGGEMLRCSPTENSELFAATIGGLGLTGLILRVALQLRHVEGLAVEAEDIRFKTLDDFFVLSLESEMDWEYTAAWIDCFAKDRVAGRGIFSRARHVRGKSADPPSRAPRMEVLLTPPFSPVNPWTMKLANALYYRRLGISGRRLMVGSYESVFYPLDAIGSWNRLYGPKGFHQFQCVIPQNNAKIAVAVLLRETANAGEGSMLAVLKMFGGLSSPGLLSFPMLGTTLALDFPARGQRTLDLLSRLEQITVNAGGRVYPAKDSAMSVDAFRVGYPAIDRFRASIDPRFSSAFARRVDLLTETDRAA